LAPRAAAKNVKGAAALEIICSGAHMRVKERERGDLHKEPLIKMMLELVSKLSQRQQVLLDMLWEFMPEGNWSNLKRWLVC